MGAGCAVAIWVGCGGLSCGSVVPFRGSGSYGVVAALALLAFVFVLHVN